MNSSQRQDRISSGAQQHANSESSASAWSNQRNTPELAHQRPASPMSVTPEPLAQVINKSPHLYSSYDRRTQYKALSSEHRQLRDFLHLSGLMQTAADDINARSRMRFVDQDGHSDTNPSTLVPEMIVTTDGVYSHPANNQDNLVEHVSANPAPVLANNENAISSVDFFDLTQFPLDEWPLFDDPSVDLGEFALVQTTGTIPRPTYQVSNGHTQFYQHQQPSGAGPSTSGNPSGRRYQGWGHFPSDMHPSEPSPWSSQPQAQ